jgi:hypothetical protein
MNRIQYIVLLGGSLLIGILVYVFEIIFSIEEDGVLNEGLESPFYEKSKVIVYNFVDPIQNYWISFWPKELMDSFFGIFIITLLWSLLGFLTTFVAMLFWRKLQEMEK